MHCERMKGNLRWWEVGPGTWRMGKGSLRMRVQMRVQMKERSEVLKQEARQVGMMTSLQSW
jgi:hypothetical protein